MRVPGIYATISMRTVNLPARESYPASYEIVEAWTSPSNRYDLSIDAAKRNTTYALPSIVPWSQIHNASLSTTSGRGYYGTSFTWRPTGISKVSGAFIDLGPIVHTVRVYVNGHQLPALDVTAAKADIGPYLVKGENKIGVVVSTPLGNYLGSIWISLVNIGRSNEAPLPSQVEEYGFVQDVVVTPYRTDTVT